MGRKQKEQWEVLLTFHLERLIGVANESFKYLTVKLKLLFGMLLKIMDKTEFALFIVLTLGRYSEKFSVEEISLKKGVDLTQTVFCSVLKFFIKD